MSFLTTNQIYSMKESNTKQPPKNFQDLVSSIIESDEDSKAEKLIKGGVNNIEIKGKIKNFTTLLDALIEPNIPKDSDFAYSEFAYLKSNPIGLSCQGTKDFLMHDSINIFYLEKLLLGFVYLNEKKIATQNKSGEELAKNVLRNLFKISGNNLKSLNKIGNERSAIKKMSDSAEKAYEEIGLYFDSLKSDTNFSLTIDQAFKIIDGWVDFADQEIIKDCKAQRNKERLFMAIKSLLVLAAASGLGFFIWKYKKNLTINITIEE